MYAKVKTLKVQFDRSSDKMRRLLCEELHMQLIPIHDIKATHRQRIQKELIHCVVCWILVWPTCKVEHPE